MAVDAGQVRGALLQCLYMASNCACITPRERSGEGVGQAEHIEIVNSALEEREQIAQGCVGVRRNAFTDLTGYTVPAVMVTSAYGDLRRLETFFDTDYHRPSDVVKPGIELGGAAEDVAQV